MISLSQLCFIAAFVLVILALLVLVGAIAIGGATGVGLLIAALICALIGWVIRGARVA